MAKGQRRSNREAKKPRSAKKKPAAVASSPFPLAPGKKSRLRPDATGRSSSAAAHDAARRPQGKDRHVQGADLYFNRIQSAVQCDLPRDSAGEFALSLVRQIWNDARETGAPERASAVMVDGGGQAVPRIAGRRRCRAPGLVGRLRPDPGRSAAALDVGFRRVVHPAPAEEAEIVEALATLGKAPNGRARGCSADAARSRARGQLGVGG